MKIDDEPLELEVEEIEEIEIESEDETDSEYDPDAELLLLVCTYAIFDEIQLSELLTEADIPFMVKNAEALSAYMPDINATKKFFVNRINAERASEIVSEWQAMKNEKVVSENAIEACPACGQPVLGWMESCVECGLEF